VGLKHGVSFLLCALSGTAWGQTYGACPISGPCTGCITNDLSVALSAAGMAGTVYVKENSTVSVPSEVSVSSVRYLATGSATCDDSSPPTARSTLYLSQPSSHRMFRVTSGGLLSIRDLDVTSVGWASNVPYDGGFVLVESGGTFGMWDSVMSYGYGRRGGCVAVEQEAGFAMLGEGEMPWGLSELRNCVATGTTSPAVAGDGGGVFTDGGVVRILGANKLENNTASAGGSGGAIYYEAPSGPVAGTYCLPYGPSIGGCAGGGDSTMVLDGMISEGGSDIVLRYNEADGNGGAIAAFSDDSELTFGIDLTEVYVAANVQK